MMAVFSGYVRWCQLCPKQLVISYSASGKSGHADPVSHTVFAIARTPHSCHNTIEMRSHYVMLPW